MAKYARGTGGSHVNIATGVFLFQDDVLLHYIEAPAVVTTEILVAVREQGQLTNSWGMVCVDMKRTVFSHSTIIIDESDNSI